MSAMPSELARMIAAHWTTADGPATAIPGLTLHRRTAPADCHGATYEPSLTVFVQGQKRVSLGGTAYLCDGSTFLLTSVDVPVMSQIVAASEERPLLSLRLTMDMAMARDISRQLGEAFNVSGRPWPAAEARPQRNRDPQGAAARLGVGPTGASRMGRLSRLSQEALPPPSAGPQGRGLAMGKTTPDLLAACSRLVDLLESPADIPFLSPLIQQEILYRLLRGPQGQRLRHCNGRKSEPPDGPGYRLAAGELR